MLKSYHKISIYQAQKSKKITFWDKYSKDNYEIF